MAGKDRNTLLRSKQYEQNISKRGNVPSSRKKAGKEKFPIGPVMLGVLLFLIVGSAIFQILNTTSSSAV